MSLREFFEELIAMQDMLWNTLRDEDKEYLVREIEEGRGNVAELWIEGDEEDELIKLQLDEEGRIQFADANTKPTHTIRMHIDTWLDILFGETTFQRAFMRGHIVFEGTNWFYHAQKWAQVAKRLNYLREYIMGK